MRQQENFPPPEFKNLTADDISFQKEKGIPLLPNSYLSLSPQERNDGLEVGILPTALRQTVLQLGKEITDGKHGNIDSLLIAQRGKLVTEAYFRRGRVNYPHYQMSITKSYTALAVGRAIQLGHLDSTDLQKPVLDILDRVDTSKTAPGVERITLHDALNMHSGIRVSKEDLARLRKQSPELKGLGQVRAYLQLTQPRTAKSRSFKYQGCDPALVMQVLEKVVPGKAETFLRKQLLAPLGIQSYGWGKDVSELPKSAAGSSLCSRDMIKIGVMVQQEGQWKGTRMIPKEYLETSTSSLYTNRQGTSYGYFWWSHPVRIDGRTLACKSARGAGGQLILLFNEIELVIVCTAHQQGMGKMLSTLPKRLLPSFVHQSKSPAN
ncbi:MAG: serine hydrolase [Planctomycetota bacterium]|nr:serine hydrolase [Planctomycetota bacterium]